MFGLVVGIGVFGLATGVVVAGLGSNGGVGLGAVVGTIWGVVGDGVSGGTAVEARLINDDPGVLTLGSEEGGVLPGGNPTDGGEEPTGVGVGLIPTWLGSDNPVLLLC